MWIEGPTMQGVIPTYAGCHSYSHDFAIPIEGNYRVKVVSFRSNFSAINEIIKEYPPMKYRVMVDELVTLNKTVGGGKKVQCADIWTAVKPDYMLPNPVTIFSSDMNRGLSNLTTHISVSSTSGREVQNNGRKRCADTVDVYDWRSPCFLPTAGTSGAADASSTTVPIGYLGTVNDTVASQILAHKRIFFMGDSHTRTFVQSLMRWACKQNLAFTKAYFGSNFGADSAHCPGLNVVYKYEYFCNTNHLPKNVKDFDLVTMNCGHHPASGEQYTIDMYRDLVSNALISVARKGYNSSNFVWVESNAQPIRNDKFVFDYKDWRTEHRLHLFNRVANEIVQGKGKYHVIPTFANTLPLADKLCDNAHFSAPESLMPQFQLLLRKLFKNSNRRLTSKLRGIQSSAIA
jgi:hypothetical protein